MTMRSSVLGSLLRQFGRPVAFSAGLLVLALTVLRPSPVQGEKPAAVLVVNDQGQAVPVAGTVALASGSLVGLTAGATVTVGNSTANPVVVRSADGNPVPQPFHLSEDAVCTSGNPVKGISATNDTGKLMVVEHVSFMVQIRKGFAVTAAAVRLDSAIPTVVFNVLSVPEFIVTFSQFGGSTPVKGYIKPGGQADLSISETSDGQCNLHFDVTGFLVNP